MSAVQLAETIAERHYLVRLVGRVGAVLSSKVCWRPLILFACLAACSTGKFGDPPEERAPQRDPGPDDPDPVDGADAGPVEEQPDAGPPDPNCMDQTVNLLTNPSFDDGVTGWLENSSFEIIVTPPELVQTPQSPAFAGWLGGFEPSVQSLAQTFTVPADATSFVVRGYRLINTADATPDNDILRFFLLDADTNVLEMLSDPAVPCTNCTYSNTSGVAAAFTPFTLTPAGNYAGQQIYLHIQSDLPDTGSITNFYLDTVAADATVCR